MKNTATQRGTSASTYRVTGTGTPGRWNWVEKRERLGPGGAAVVEVAATGHLVMSVFVRQIHSFNEQQISSNPADYLYADSSSKSPKQRDMSGR